MEIFTFTSHINTDERILEFSGTLEITTDTMARVHWSHKRWTAVFIFQKSVQEYQDFGTLCLIPLSFPDDYEHLAESFVCILCCEKNKK